MSNVFVALLLVSLVGLAWGLIAPQHTAKTARLNRPVTRKHTGAIFGCLAIAFFVVVGVTALPQTTPNKLQKVNLTAQPAQSQADIVTTKQVADTQVVPFAITNRNDSNLPQGQTKVLQVGKNGVKTLTYEIGYVNGQQTSQTLVKSTVTTQPVNQIVAIGTYVAPSTPAPAVNTPAYSPAPAPKPAPKPSCYPLTNSGNCYEPGEFCRASDHGAYGVAGDGKAITCLDNDGWRWEP